MDIERRRPNQPEDPAAELAKLEQTRDITEGALAKKEELIAKWQSASAEHAGQAENHLQQAAFHQEEAEGHQIEARRFEDLVLRAMISMDTLGQRREAVESEIQRRRTALIERAKLYREMHGAASESLNRLQLLLELGRVSEMDVQDAEAVLNTLEQQRLGNPNIRAGLELLRREEAEAERARLAKLGIHTPEIAAPAEQATSIFDTQFAEPVAQSVHKDEEKAPTPEKMKRPAKLPDGRTLDARGPVAGKAIDILTDSTVKDDPIRSDHLTIELYERDTNITRRRMYSQLANVNRLTNPRGFQTANFTSDEDAAGGELASYAFTKTDDYEDIIAREMEEAARAFRPAVQETKHTPVSHIDLVEEVQATPPPPAETDQEIKTVEEPEIEEEMEPFTQQEAGVLGAMIMRRNGVHVRFADNQVQILEFDDDILDAAERQLTLTTGTEEDEETTEQADMTVIEDLLGRERRMILGKITRMFLSEDVDTLIDKQNPDVQTMLIGLYFIDQEQHWGSVIEEILDQRPMTHEIYEEGQAPQTIREVSVSIKKPVTPMPSNIVDMPQSGIIVDMPARKPSEWNPSDAQIKERPMEILQRDAEIPQKLRTHWDDLAERLPVELANSAQITRVYQSLKTRLIETAVRKNVVTAESGGSGGVPAKFHRREIAKLFIFREHQDLSKTEIKELVRLAEREEERRRQEAERQRQQERRKR